MSEEQVRQLTDMGATVAQAKAALAQYKDVMQAAERFFEGAFDHVKDDDGDSPMASASAPPVQKRTIRMATPEDDDEDTPAGDGSGEEDEEDDGEDDFIDYDSDDGPTADAPRTNSDADPYARVFFSKDHREEIIEVEEEPELVYLPGHTEQVKLMTQGEWMKGCPPPSGGEQSFLFALYSQLSDGKCVCPHECGSSVLRTKSDFFPIFPEFESYIAHLRRVVPKTCQRCHSEFCFACGEPITEKVQRPGAAAPGDPLFHCADIQGVILGVGLSMLEQMFTEQAHDSSVAQDPKTRNSKRRKTGKMFSKDTDDDDDEAYYNLGPSGKRAKGGVGYAGDQKEDNSGQIEAQAIQAAKDAKIGTLLTEIGVYLPSLHREGHHPSDFLPHPTALAHLRRRFNYVSSALLRNDSLADMSDRSILYFKLLEWLETISAHEALASMMAMPIMTISSVKAVTTRKSANNTPIRERTIIYEGSAGPRELLEAVAIQAHAALKALESSKAPDAAAGDELTEEQKRMTVDSKGKFKEVSAPIADENQKLLDFCQRIHATANAIDRSLRETKGDAFVERLHASLPKILTSSSSNEGMLVDAGATEESATKAYVEWATRVRFEYCDLTIPATTPAPNESEPQLPHYKSYYNNEIRMLSLSDIPKRSLAIAKELSILTNNLPIAWDSSIFLRIDESRVDVIKALITGPEGTPYYNGCYLFDIFLGASYNQSPPSVKYMTTSGGKFRFNPNLYADGKVCLSLLGTWQGPGWVSGRSTLLQVLISIQSMILCEEPYLNEPGWAQSAGTPQSRAYSANVRRMVVRTAMLGNLQNPPEPFADIIRTHFRLKARSISTQLDQWLAQDDGKATLGDGAGFDGIAGRQSTGTSSNGLAADVTEMKKLLKELQAGFGTSRRA